MSRLYNLNEQEKKQIASIKPTSRFHNFSERDKAQIRATTKLTPTKKIKP